MGFSPSSLVDGFTAAQQFIVRFLRTAEKEIGMRKSVVAEEVAACGGLLDERGGFANVLADHKKGGLGVVAVQEIEEFGSDGGIGAVVEGESQIAAPAGLVKSVAE